jgi:rifampicin phosphotransferase
MTFVPKLAELSRFDIDAAGSKGANLGEMTRLGLPVPPGFVVTTEAYRAFVEEAGIGAPIQQLAARLTEGAEATGLAEQISALFSTGSIPDDLRAGITKAYRELGEEVAVAVRSSATAEDLPEASFAGQQDTYLNVRGTERLLEAVRDCWASLWTARAMTYRSRQRVDPDAVALAVVVQEMVEAEAAGVMFTANPASGAHDEAVISAAWGLGESVVGGFVNPDNLVVRKPAGPVLSRNTADKAVMTSYTDRGTEERPVPPERRTEPVLDDAAAIQLTGLGARIEAHYGAPQDIEWAWRDGRFFILQSRPITALPETEGAVPTDWTVPQRKTMYVRASIVEQLPDPLSPLFADLIDGAVTRSITSLFIEFLGRNVIHDGDLALPTINGYAYYAYTRDGMARIMLQVPKAMKVFVRSDQYGARPRWRHYSHPRYEAIVARWAGQPIPELASAELIDGVVELLDAGAEYYTSVQTIIPLAATSEVIFTWFYNALVRRPGDPPAQTFLLGFDSEPIRAEKSLFDLATEAKAQPALATALKDSSSDSLVELWRQGKSAPGVEKPTWSKWLNHFQNHLDRFGHAVYNLDFINPVPADEPAPLLDTVRFYLHGRGRNPYQRQSQMVERREQATAAVLARLDPARRSTFLRLLRWAQDVAPVREDALADVGLGWPQMRRMLAEIGRRLVMAGVIEGAEDVYWLRLEELRTQSAALESGQTGRDLRGQVAERRQIWRGQRRVTPPQLLPKGVWFYGMDKMLPAVSEDQTGDVIKGIAASGGEVTAAARVLGGPQDFGQMQPGDVLVASITTPAWTSLFAMASAVVTDIGGPLSHSSIVAREYGIPAVLGTAVATRRISSGERIRVDGDAGTVTLLDQQGIGAGTEVVPTGTRAARKQALVALTAVAGFAAAAWALRRRRSG